MKHHHIQFWGNLAKLPREEIMEMIKKQDPQIEGQERKTLYEQVRLIEDVFRYRLTHLTWSDGTPVEGKDFTNQELAWLVDPPFRPDLELERMGFSEQDQRMIHISSDSVLWAKHILQATPRAYQIVALRHPNLRKILRWGRRLGKTYMMSILLLHYSYTTKNGRCLIMAPMKSQVELVYEQCMELINGSPIVKSSLGRHVTSPQFYIDLKNGSTMRFFTTGMKSGGKADNIRGQEGHLIILDEMDYMGDDDTTAIYAMLQDVKENMPEKQLIAASTPSGRREKFYDWCVRKRRFKEFWFPSYCNPMWKADTEEEQREILTEMGYRHEIEADWGEIAEGVYPHKYVNRAFITPSWKYEARRTKTLNGVDAESIYLIGVDWDKYGAGPNIVVLEVCGDDHPDQRARGRLRITYRQEVPRSEFVLDETVQRIIELNAIFLPEHIYMDRGSGEMQIELLHKYGMERPQSGLRTKITGVQFGETIEIRDPATKMPTKKPIKPFMVENLRWLLEKDQIIFPGSGTDPDDDKVVYKGDDELYNQLTAYVVVRETEAGKPVFEASGTAQDHAHDALILACLAYTRNYDALHRIIVARRSYAIRNDVFLPIGNPDVDNKSREDKGFPAPRKRSMTIPKRRNRAAPIVRKKF